ncbi:MAG: tRNA pseudouridine(38-40) synthase TruA [Saprospiraceae bacterium]|nr:tRNA pseudouridine(38-40) synthase TruA [Saprospiraceae bacterium]
MRYLLHIGFDGSNYIGWQRQPVGTSVQETIEDALKRIFKTDITVYGCGRTDSGVHASQYMFHITLIEALDFDLKFRLNKNLPDEIAVYDIVEIENNQHARYDATWRTYDYFIHLYKDPFLSRYSSLYEYDKLDFEAMKKAAALLPLYSDFKALCRRSHIYKHTKCQVTQAKLFVDTAQQRVRFTITANRFLHGMVRISVHFLLEIGRGNMTLEEFEKNLANQIEVPVKRLAHPTGLYLTRVEYPYLNIPPRPNITSFLKRGLED